MSNRTVPSAKRGVRTYKVSELPRAALLVKAIQVHGYLPLDWRHPLPLKKDAVTGELQPRSNFPRTLWASPIDAGFDELGFVLAMQHRTKTRKIGGGFECVFDGYRATGATWGEAIVRASLIKFEAEGERHEQAPLA